MAPRAGDRLRNHAAVGQENAGRQIACFARGSTERRANQRLRLLFHHRDETVPHDLKLDAGELAHDDFFRLSSTMCPALLTDASKSAVTMTVVWSSTISA